MQETVDTLESTVADGPLVTDVQSRVNARLWSRPGLAKVYANRELRPAEVMVLVRYREGLSARVLELGCGAGRLTGYLDGIAQSVHAIDISPEMVAACRRAYPRVTVEDGDLRDLSAFADGSFEAVVAGYNVVDVVNDEDRRRLLDEVLRILSPEGILVMSSHNRAAAPPEKGEISLRNRGLLRAGITLVRLPRWLRNRRRLLPYQRREPGYAILNDVSHDYGALHYYITRDAQEGQLAEHGFELLECLDRDGRRVKARSDAPETTELHYVARLSVPPA